MNKAQVSIICAIIVVILCLGTYLVFSLNDNGTIKGIHYAYTIETTEVDNCSDSVSFLYADSINDINYYSYCLKSINIKGKAMSDTLVNAFSNGVTINDIMKDMKLKSTANDGGTKWFIDDGATGYTNNGLTVIACNALNYDDATSSVSTIKDYYIGPKNMTYRSEFCKRKEVCSFTKTYTIVSILDSDDETQKYVTLNQFQGGETATILIDSASLLNINTKDSIEITFSGNYIVNSTSLIDDIFKNNIMSIIKTTKTGLDQINDDTCKN